MRLVVRMWPKAIIFVLCGFLILGRSFAYLGIPPAKMFVGELLLGTFCLARPRDVIGRWFSTIMRPSALSGCSIAILLFLLYGCFELFRGIVNEYPFMTGLQSFVFHLYPLYIFVGVWTATRRPDAVSRLIPVLAWLHGIYGLLYMTVLSGKWIALPGSNVNMVGQPNGTVVVVLGLLCMPRLRPKDWGALLLNLVVLMGLQVRADWLAIMVTIVLWGILGRKLGHLSLAGLLAFAVLCGAWVANVSIPGPQDRGGDVTAEKMMARIIAPFDIDTAKDLDSAAATYKGTTTWRTTWWDAIWKRVHHDTDTTFFGLGYGYPIADLVPYLRDQEIRSPHNVFFYALAYGGWFGVTLFFWFQLQVIRLGWNSYQATGNLFGLLVAIEALIAGLFGNLFETPFGAIPIYLLVGLNAAPLVRREQAALEYSPLTQLLPAARW
jgi:hypothetical protein